MANASRSTISQLIGAPVDAPPGVFWSAAARHGTPLYNPDTGQRIFLWRQPHASADPEGASSVHLSMNRVTDKEHYDDGFLSHIPGTDIWWLALELPEQLRASYGFVVHNAHDIAEPLRPDPLNSLPQLPHRDDTCFSVYRGSTAPAQPEWEYRRPARSLENSSRVVHETLTMDDGVARPHWLYMPSGSASGPLPLLTLFDADLWFGNRQLTTALDAARASGRIPDLAVLGVGHTDAADRRHSLSANTAFLTQVVTQSTAWAQDQATIHNIGFAPQSQRAVAGQSLGGLSALLAAVEFPEQYGAVLAHSPSMWWRPGGKATPADLASLSETPWITSKLSASTPSATIRLSVGTREGLMTPHVADLNRLLLHNGWDVAYAPVVGGHDFAWWRGALLNDLQALWGQHSARAR